MRINGSGFFGYVWNQNSIDDVYDSVGGLDVGSDDLGVINVQFIRFDGKFE